MGKRRIDQRMRNRGRGRRKEGLGREGWERRWEE